MRKTPRIVSRIKSRRAIWVGPKSRVPLGRVGFSIILQNYVKPQFRPESRYIIGNTRREFAILRGWAYIRARIKRSQEMAVTRLKRKNRKDRSVSSKRRQALKNQNFKPVIRAVDVEKIKEEFKAKKA